MITLPATIPGLLRRGCTVVGFSNRGVVLWLYDDDRAVVAWFTGGTDWRCPTAALHLDLRDPLTQSAVWLWLEAHDDAQAAFAGYDGDPRTPEGLRDVVLSLVGDVDP